MVQKSDTPRRGTIYLLLLRVALKTLTFGDTYANIRNLVFL